MSQRWPVALVQFQVSPEPQVNRQQVRHWLERAMAPGQTSPSPKLLMLPEVWNSPYQAERFAEFAEPIPEPGADLLDGPSASLKVVAEVAVSHGVSVIAGSIPERSSDGRIFNTATVIGPQGRLLAKHRKMHLFDVDIPGGIHFHESDSLTAGDQITVLSGVGDPLASGVSCPPNLGLQICYDIRFPELALLMQQQLRCDLIACPAGFSTTTGPLHWHLVMRARAVDTSVLCWLAAAPGLQRIQATTPVMATRWWWIPGGTSWLRPALVRRWFMPSWTSIKSRQHGLPFPPLANGARMSTGLSHQPIDDRLGSSLAAPIPYWLLNR